MKLNKSKKSKFTTMKAQSKNKFTTKKLSKGNYFVQIRTYVKVGKKKVYSSWQTYDLMAVIGGKMKPEKGRFHIKTRFDGKSTTCYAPKEVSKAIKIYGTYHWSYIYLDKSVFIEKNIAWSIGSDMVWVSDINGNVIEKGIVK